METYFDDLKESNEFLNILLDNMNSAVLIADENLQIYHFNDNFLQLFRKSEDRVLIKRFGKATGCIYSVEERKACGETSQCESCILRRSALKTLTEKVPVDKVKLERMFYINGVPTTKFLEISTRHVHFQGKKMILIIIYDVTDIEEQKIELQRKQHQIDQDLKAAAGIQESLLPAYSPWTGALNIAWKFEPYSQIGGDIFNLHYPDRNNIELYMLDVCGHGVPAALIAVSVSQFLQSKRSLSEGESGVMSPEEVLNSLEQAFPFERFDSYFTIVYMAVDFSQGRLTYSCAGHPPPILLRSNGELKVLDRHGPAIGLGTNQPFGQEEERLQLGDKVILYTDGSLENSNSAGEVFGTERFYEVLHEHRNESAHGIVDAVYSAVKKFGRDTELDDDISILVAEYVGKQQAAK
ncbi:MAG: SpoIIE family protein phosphatase [Desulfobacterales bacterium]|nr:SpoIIE family protein phosphatase [Deltaproteobacteria bacterium]NIR12652.1 SpoIIE family protein phosphatase [Desulfobacterales bacterium]